MTPALFILIALAGGLGAAARVVIDHAVMRGREGGYPWGITAVNLTGCLALGFVAGATSLDTPWASVAAVGFLGGYTTFSTVMVDVALALQGERWGRAALNGGVLIVGAVALATIGLALGRALAA